MRDRVTRLLGPKSMRKSFPSRVISTKEMTQLLYTLPTSHSLVRVYPVDLTFQIQRDDATAVYPTLHLISLVRPAGAAELAGRQIYRVHECFRWAPSAFRSILNSSMLTITPSPRAGRA